MSLLDLSRWQFALTVCFHMTFPAITVGMSVFLCVIYAMYWHTQKPVYLQMFRFWRRIFAVGFALGVVAGAVITFQMGLNWGVFGAKTGPIIGPIIGMEVVTAFFVEAGFIGILLYGDGRVRHITMFASTVMVALSSSSIRYMLLSGRACSNVILLFQLASPASRIRRAASLMRGYVFQFSRWNLPHSR